MRSWGVVALIALGTGLALVIFGLWSGRFGAGIGLVSSSGGVITLDPGIRYQTITGWEATSQAGQTFPEWSSYGDTLIEWAVDDLGINRLRLEIRSGAESDADYFSQFESGQIDHGAWKNIRYATANDNDDPDVINWAGFHFTDLDQTIEAVVIPMKERLEARGEKLYVNLTYVAFTHNMTPGYRYIHADPEEYAEFVFATYLHMQREYGFVPDAWEVILEPDNRVEQWNGAVIGRAILAAASKLEANGFTPRFIAPSTTNMSASLQYFDDMAKVLGPAGVSKYVSEISYHRYRGVSDRSLRDIAGRAKQYGINTAMLEHIGSGYEALHQDLKVGNNSAWQQFTLAFPTKDNGAQYYFIDNSNRGNRQVKMGNRTRFLRQYFKYVRAGAQRIEASSDDGDFDPVAFVNQDGRFVLVVKASSGGTFSVDGLPAGRYGTFYTTGSQYDVSTPEITLAGGSLLNASIPSGGVITVYQK